MKVQAIFILLICLCSGFSSFAQEKEEGKVSSPFSIGLNIGAYFANNNTAEIYTGTPSVTPFGVLHILRQPLYRQRFDDYFEHPYDIAEFPIDPAYKTSLEIGLHLGFQVSQGLSFFMDLNSSRLRYEQFFTIEIDDPRNQLPGPTFEQIPIFGEENRLNINLGTQLNFYRAETVNAYFSFFGNVNSIELNRNYFVINNISYEILHQDFNDPSQKPRGVGYGAGGGMGFKFDLTENILLDFYYNLLYSQTNLTDELQPFGLHHSIGIRVIWNKRNSNDGQDEDW